MNKPVKKMVSAKTKTKKTETMPKMKNGGSMKKKGKC